MEEVDDPIITETNMKKGGKEGKNILFWNLKWKDLT